MGPFIQRRRTTPLRPVTRETPYGAILRTVRPLEYMGIANQRYETEQRRGSPTGILLRLEHDAAVVHVRWENGHENVYDADCFEVV